VFGRSEEGGEEGEIRAGKIGKTQPLNMGKSPNLHGNPEDNPGGITTITGRLTGSGRWVRTQKFKHEKKTGREREPVVRLGSKNVYLAKREHLIKDHLRGGETDKSEGNQLKKKRIAESVGGDGVRTKEMFFECSQGEMYTQAKRKINCEREERATPNTLLD